MIKSKLRAALLKEGAHKANEYGCLMVYLDADKSEWDKMQEVIDADDLYDPKDETGYGLESEPHVTILYGLHSTIEDKDIEVEINKIKNPKIKLGKVSSFTNKLFDVLKFDIESSDLHKLNKKFCEFPYTSDYPDYHPHCTAAYLKKGLAEKYIKILNKYLTEHSNLEVKPEKLVYSKANGEKKDYGLG